MYKGSKFEGKDVKTNVSSEILTQDLLRVKAEEYAMYSLKDHLIE